MEMFNLGKDILGQSLMSFYIRRGIIFFIHPDCPYLFEHFYEQHSPFHGLVSRKHFFLFAGFIDALGLARIGNGRGQVLNVLIQDDPLLVVKVRPDKLLPFVVVLSLKLLDLPRIGAHLDQPVVFPRDLQHIFGKGDDLPGLSGVLLEPLYLILPEPLVEGSQLEADVIVDLVLGGDLEDSADSPLHNPLQRSVLVGVMGLRLV